MHQLEREAIQPHLQGRFEDMLLAVEQHPAMLVYLNNAQSFGPNSRFGKRRKKDSMRT
ncbi:bll7425 protein [Vibrio ishigakensis]|uniref:Bll7425 protein n=1 Tax=Vibrio ishigakensis TaxID=1481914 RepID=A0A0B8NY96_9VIBR|nr:bll7425 protein [Vibrio ishigakensis]